MNRNILRLLAVIIILVCTVSPVFADTTALVHVTANPLVSNGIADFLVTYVSDTEMDITWVLTGDAVNIMIRAKYGQYPANIPDQDTAPSDGYLVYYGSGTSAVDTSMNFDENPGGLYYSAWAQRADGTWYVITMQDWKESAELLLLAFIAVIAIVIGVNFGVRNSFLPMKLIGAFLWAIPFVWLTTTPPSLMPAGSALNQVMIILLIGLFAVSMFSVFRRPLQLEKSSTDKFGGQNTSGYQSAGWHLPGFMQGRKNEEEMQREFEENRLETKRQHRAEHWRKFHRGEDDKENPYV